jgi:hypothetical protein
MCTDPCRSKWKTNFALPGRPSVNWCQRASPERADSWPKVRLERALDNIANEQEPEPSASYQRDRAPLKEMLSPMQRARGYGSEAKKRDETDGA